MTTDVITRVLDDLAGHPGSAAKEIAGRLDLNGQIVFLVLKTSEEHGQARRTPGKPVRWQIIKTPGDAGA